MARCVLFGIVAKTCVELESDARELKWITYDSRKQARMSEERESSGRGREARDVVVVNKEE